MIFISLINKFLLLVNFNLFKSRIHRFNLYLTLEYLWLQLLSLNIFNNFLNLFDFLFEDCCILWFLLDVGGVLVHHWRLWSFFNFQIFNYIFLLSFFFSYYNVVNLNNLIACDHPLFGIYSWKRSWDWFDIPNLSAVLSNGAITAKLTRFREANDCHLGPLIVVSICIIYLALRFNVRIEVKASNVMISSITHLINDRMHNFNIAK